MMYVSEGIDYARDIASGKIVSSKYVKLQCEQFIDDLDNKQNQDDYRWKFDTDLAQHVLSFISLLKFVEGSVAGEHVKLSPWQSFIFINAYGWVDKKDPEIRRFTKLICMVGRKNAKSTILGCWALYELMFAPEGSQLFSMATTKDQAKLVWNMANRMIDVADPRLFPNVSQTISAIANKDKWSRFVPLSKESKRLDGLNARMAIVDESAAITDQNLFEVLSSSMGAQKSPQMVHITTGQPGAQSNYFYTQLDYAKKNLDGIVEDERFFCMAYELDHADDWQDPSNFIKSNPNLGLSVSEEFLLEELEMAKNIPSAATNFRVKYLNEFLNTASAWLDPKDYQAGNVAELDTTMPCYIGLDLGATSDLCAVSFVWAKDGEFHADYMAWIPENALKVAPKHTLPTYRMAIESGILRVTEGEIADHDAIYDYLLEFCSKNNVIEVAYDSWSATHLTARLLDKGLPMVRMDQSMKALSPASKEVEMLVKTGRIKHKNQPFIDWCISNCEVYTDVNENIKIRKGEDAALKIDPIVALIMATGRACANGALTVPKLSFYFG